MELRGQVLAACRRALHDYREYVVSENPYRIDRLSSRGVQSTFTDPKNVKQMKDGTLFTLTIEVSVFTRIGMF